MLTGIPSLRARRGGAAMVLAVLALSSVEVQAEWRHEVYGGRSDMFDSDVWLHRPGGTDLTLSDVPWRGESLRPPIYYGTRLTYWSDAVPWGLALDFTNAKMIARSDDTVAVGGTHAGVPVSGDETAGDTISSSQISHGLNLLTLNGLYRFGDSCGLGAYAGLGAGVAIPRVETGVGGVETQDDQVGGPVAQGLLGFTYNLYGRFSVFAEYKLSYADISADLGGGTLDMKPWTNHFLAGLSFRLY